MSKRKATLAIICEDTQQECFARKFLYRMGWNNRQLRVVKNPSGRGSGEQWVREKYAQELANYRRSHVNYAFMAIVDGDNHGVRGRIKQFDNKCIELEFPVRDPKDQVAIIVPTRNIETWISYLEGKQVDETSSYPKLHFESDCQAAVDTLLRYCKRSGLPSEAPGSLQAACAEFITRIQR
ncbi:MAG: hypothetical protein PHW20_01270 [Clostridia bacterium]|nr:hypothetical protein [Clostridia bacterium]